MFGFHSGDPLYANCSCMTTFQTEQKLHYTLRFASAMCFIGHGAFGIITKPIWLNYFAVFGIGKATAYHMMPFVGIFDIICGILMLVYPLRIIPLWLVIWGALTALMRPMSGEPIAEFIERAGNFGAPLALLLLSGGVKWNVKNLFTPIDPEISTGTETMAQVINCLKIVVFMLLAGHGWLNLIEKKGLVGQYAMLGFYHPGTTARYVGIFELAAAVTMLIKPVRAVILGLLLWKVMSELFYPHWELFEWIERGGSYGAILALWFALGFAKEAPQSSGALQAT